MNCESIGKQITYIRENRGFSQARLAQKTGIDCNIIEKYENGTIELLDAEYLENIANALEVSCFSLLGEASSQEDTGYFIEIGGNELARPYILNPEEAIFLGFLRNVKNKKIKDGVMKILRWSSKLDT